MDVGWLNFNINSIVFVGVVNVYIVRHGWTTNLVCISGGTVDASVPRKRYVSEWSISIKPWKASGVPDQWTVFESVRLSENDQTKIYY